MSGHKVTLAIKGQTRKVTLVHQGQISKVVPVAQVMVARAVGQGQVKAAAAAAAMRGRRAVGKENDAMVRLGNIFACDFWPKFFFITHLKLDINIEKYGVDLSVVKHCV